MSDAPPRHITPSPSFAVLVKLGSLAVHVEEFLSPDGHAFDREAIVVLLDDPEVKEWLAEMDKAAFLPKKRNRR